MAVKISAAQVKELRDKTGIAMGECKKALEETEGDLEGAVKVLRERGQMKAEKRAGRDASEGLIAAAVSDDKKKAVLAQISCETDFVSRNDEFIKLVQDIADAGLAAGSKTVDEIKEVKLASGKSVADSVEDIRTKIGEKIELSKYEAVEGDVVASYIHPPGKIGVLISSTGSASDANAAHDTLRGIAMHVAASAPRFLDSSQVDQKVLEDEREIFANQARNEGKPDNIIDKIVDGKIKSFYKDNCLVDQPFVQDPKKSVSQVVKEIDGELKLTGFSRINIGSAG